MAKKPTGWTQLGIVDDDGVWTPRSRIVCNARMASSGLIAARCLGFGDMAYKIAVAYMEFANLSDPTTTVSTPSPNKGDSLSYYTGLSSSPNADYLRLPLRVSPALGVFAGNEAYFPNGGGDLLSFFIQSAGNVGMNGKPFGPAHNSKVYGVALVATPVPNDATQDILYSRAYYGASDQLIVPANGQVGAPYIVPMGPP
jgi:hypothetical protein